MTNRTEEKATAKNLDWAGRARKGFLASGIDPADRRGHKNYYIDLLQKMALEEVLELRGDEVVLDFGCGSGRVAHWIASKVRKVVGLEVTPEMIDLAEKNQTVENVEFMLYDGVHLPVFPCVFDLVLSVWVLQYMEDGAMKKAVSMLAHSLREGGRFCLIEQVSDNPKIDRPRAKDYLQAFEEAKLSCLLHYPIRSSRWGMLYMIRYGMIPKKWFPAIAGYELEKRREETGRICFYKDYLFFLRKKES